VVVGVGNELDLRFHEYLDFLARHEDTSAIVCYVEGFRDARAFLQVATRVSRAKPVLVLKGARSPSGMAAARSHTGAVSGEYDRLRAGLRQAGVVEVTRTDELLHLAETLATQPAMRPERGVAILSDGGGQGTLAADALSDLGIPLATLSTRTREALRGLLGGAAAVGNPVDLAGAADADPGVFGRALGVLSEDEAVGGALVVGLFGGYGIRFAEQIAEAEECAATVMADTMRAAGRALVVHSMYASHRSPPLRTLGRLRVPVVESLEVACRCIAETWLRGGTLARPAWRPDDDPEAVAPRAGRRLKSMEGSDAVAAARREEREGLTEPEARALLREAGLSFPPAALCTTPAEAAAAVRGMRTAAAMKVVSAHIPHKTDAGGVALGIGTPDEAAEAFAVLEERAARFLETRGLTPGIDGVLVAPMLASPLAELLIGARRDPELGPVLTVGAGGIWVEVLRDVVHRVLPVDENELRNMLEELRTFAMLAGVRGRPRADLEAVVRAAAAVGRCLLDNEDVAEVEVNPLFAYATGVEAVDARIFLRAVEQGAPSA
jgi:acetyltransferase